MPLVNHFINKIGIEELFDKYIPSTDRRITLSHSKALGVLLRSIIVEREFIYRQQETVEAFHPHAFGLLENEVHLIGDDRIGRALDELFESDRAAMLSELVVSSAKQFDLKFERVHNDTTSIRFCGQYNTERKEKSLKRTALITYGFSKDHRPDLKQLVMCLTTTSDGGVPVQFKCLDGNTSDVDTHIQTWDTLRQITGRTNFLYVADCKLCSRENMDHIDRNGGRFVTVMPRTHLEDGEFRKWIQTNEPQWQKVWDRPNPRKKYAPRDRWFVFEAPLPSREAWPVVWVYSTLLALRQERTRREHISAATQKLVELRDSLPGSKSRLRKAQEIDERINDILRHFKVTRYLKVKRFIHKEYTYRQNQRGRPGPDTTYRKITRRKWKLDWQLDKDAIEYDRKSDGMYPLLTNDSTLAPAVVLEAHKGQPCIEKRFEQIKTVHEIAPMFLKKPQRVEALFTLYFIGMFLQALIERQVRNAMKKRQIKQISLYPEERSCTHPTTEQILRLFSHTQMQTLTRNNQIVQFFYTQFTTL